MRGNVCVGMTVPVRTNSPAITHACLHALLNNYLSFFHPHGKNLKIVQFNYFATVDFFFFFLFIRLLVVLTLVEDHEVNRKQNMD